MNELIDLLYSSEAEIPLLWPPDAKSQLIGKDPDAGKTEGKRRGQQKMRQLDSISNSVDMNLSKLWEIVEDRRAWYAAVHGVAKRHDFANESKKIRSIDEDVETLEHTCMVVRL